MSNFHLEQKIAIERLIAKCEYKDEVIDQRNIMCARVEAENERLRAVLQYIAYPQYDDRKYELMAAARAALETDHE